jgi:predicted nicotinamide N-methyase
LTTSSEALRIGDVELMLVRPSEPAALLDEDAFAEDEFMPYWAELWPAGLALPSLVAAARGADVTAVDWAADAIGLLRENATRNALTVEAVHADWRSFDGDFDLALAADVLYEARNVEPLVHLLPRLAPEALVALAGRPYEAEFLHLVVAEPWRRLRCHMEAMPALPAWPFAPADRIVRIRAPA